MIITQPKEIIAAYVNVRQQQPPTALWGSFNAIGLVRNGVLVAGVIYNDFSDRNAFIHIGAEEGRRWMTKDFLFAAFDYPFNQLGLERVTALIRQKNDAAVAFAKHLGFTYEGKLRSFFKDSDGLVYGMTRKECRFLTEFRKAA